MYKNAENEMVLCPYNRTHVVSRLRIQKHIIKCQKNYPHIKLATCFYNYTHKLQPGDLLKHYEICSHKTRIEGARYYEPINYKPVDLPVKSEDYSFNFPPSYGKVHKDFRSFSAKSDSSSTIFEYDPYVTLPHSKNHGFSNMDNKSFSKADDDDDDDDDDDYKPLPLPKTVSKAFTCIKQQQEKSLSSTSKTFQRKGFGRATNVLACSPTRQPRTTDHLLPDVSDMDTVFPKKNKSFKFLPSTNTSCSLSVVSSMFDDSTTLKSQTIIFDDDFEDDNNGFALKNFDKYVKI